MHNEVNSCPYLPAAIANAGIVFNASICLSVCLRVCVYVCVNKPKSGSVVWLRVFWQVFVCLFVLLSQQNLVSVATVGDADMKLGRCVTATNMQVEFDDGCDTTS